MTHNSAAAHSQAHIGCNHCETDTPAPTGARVRGWFTAVAAILAITGCAIGMVMDAPWWVEGLLVAATIVGSVFPAQRAWQSIKRFSLDINVLMVIAVMGAMAIGEYEEAAMVVTLFAAAQWLEAQSLDRARQAIGRLLNLAPSDVLVRDDAGERLIDIELVTPGALMIVRPGEKFALDGIVRNGHSDVNQAPITGESLPVEKTEGDEVFAGTINGHGALTVAVTRRRHDTHARAHRQPRGVGASQTRAAAAIHRSLCGVVHAVHRRAGRARGGSAARGGEPVVRPLVVSRAGAAGGVVSLRARDFDAGVDRVGARRRRQARCAREGRHSSRAPRYGSRGRIRQDRDGDHGQSDARRGSPARRA